MKKLFRQVVSIAIALTIFIMPLQTVSADYTSGRIGIAYQGDNEIHYIGTDVQSSICLQLTDSDTRSNNTYSWYSSDESVLLFQVQAYTDDYKSCAIFQGASEGTAVISTNISSDSEKVLVSVSTPIDDTSAKTNKTTNVYAAASSNSTVRRVLDANYSLTINAKCGDYYRVEFTDGTGSDSIFEGEYYINKSDLSISTSSIVFDTGFIELENGESHNTIVTILPAISNTTVRWFSSDDTIATVDQNGIITAVGAGITQITAVDVTNGVSNNIVVSVFKYSSDLTFRAIPDYNYIKDEIKPRIMIKDGTDILDKNSDYDVSYSNNVNVGTAEVTITFKNHYKGTKKLYFEIIPSEVEDVFEVNDIIDQKYNFGNPITPQIPVFCNGKQLVLGTDYNISYYNNIDCGTATAVITGMNGFTGSITKYFNITSISSSDPRISVSAIANVAYTGDSVTPSVTVQYDGVNLIKGQDYTVEYENNIFMGLATARITFKGNYSGEIEKNFYIVPKKSEIISEIIDNSFVAEKDCVYFEYKSQADFIDNEQYQMIYLVERNDSVLGSVSNGFFDDDGLPSCTPYKYRIKAGYQSVDYSVVNFGEWSDYYYVGTAPDNLTLTVGHNSANYPLLTVTGQGTKSNGITVKYEIWRYENANLYDAGELSMLADNMTSSTYTDTSAQTGKSYWYTVRPYYEISVPESNGTTSIRRIYGDYTDKEWGDMPLPTPMNFTAVYNEETGDIRFTWKDVPSTMADKYHIVNYDDGGASQEGQIVEGNSYTWNAAELTPNTTYRFRILSENTLYNTHSNPSSCIIIITTLKTPQISKLSTGSNRNGIKIELSDTYLGRYYYEIYYSSSNTNGFKYINTISYKIPYAFLCDPDATYSFKVRAVVNQNNQKYYSEYSTIKSFTLGLKEPSVTSISRDDTNNCFNLQWSSVNKAVSYNIYAYKGGTTGKYIKNVTGASTNIPYSSLDSGSYYHFKVRAIGNNTDSDISSNYGLGVTPVSGLSVSSNSPGTATVVFTKGNCPTYRIEYKKSSESDNDYKPVTVDTNSHTIHGLVETTTYNFRVKGIKNNSWSGMSKVVNCNISRTMPTLVKITKDNVSICVGNTYKLKAEVTPLNASQSVNWSSSDTSVATVDVDGTVTAKKAGTVTIKATSTLNSNKYGTCTVAVVNKAVVMIHGRGDNTSGCFGAENNIKTGDNDHFNPDINAKINKSGSNLKYTSVEAQRITDIQNVHSEGGNIAYYLSNNNYTKNINMFAFNYPNEDAVIHNANKFRAYINNLTSYAKTSGSNNMKAAFFGTSDITANSDFTFNIIGHSMGGLVARYYIENCTNHSHYLADSHSSGSCTYNDNHVDKLITIDTPHWGSGWADFSNCVDRTPLHLLCDHDLDTSSRIFGGNNPSYLINECNKYKGNTLNYRLTDELNYNRTRHTQYFAIAGINLPAWHYIGNNIGFEINPTATKYLQIEDAVENVNIAPTESMPFENNVESYMQSFHVKSHDDNIVQFLSQIGWTNNSGDAPDKKISIERIFVNIDSNGGNNIYSHLHSKMMHRKIVINKVEEYLGR